VTLSLSIDNLSIQKSAFFELKSGCTFSYYLLEFQIKIIYKKENIGKET